VEISIQDNGRGIAPEHLAHIFDPFFTTKSRGEGTGLGLYICQLIVSQHNGVIDVTSEPGQGTRVTVQFPAAPSTPLEE
jgi:signal transduction histidine kinase